MGHLSIHCGGCGSDWIVYHRDDFKNWKARTCPVCGKATNPQTWEKQVLRAFGEMEDAGMELVKDHTQLHGTLFTVGYVPDVAFPSEDDMRGEIENLRSIVMKMLVRGEEQNDF